MRDIMFVVLPCTGQSPISNGVVGNTGGTLTGPNSIEVCDGEYFCVDVQFTDADAGTTLDITSLATTLLPGATFTVVGTNPAVATICWTGDITNSPVNVLVQAADGNCPIQNITSTSINITTSQTAGTPPDAGVDGSITTCSNAASFALFGQLGGTPTAGGSWAYPNGTAHTGQFDPAVDAAGIYRYAVGNACGSDTSYVTVNVNTAPNAGTNGTVSLCSSSASVSLFAQLGGSPQAGGAWSGPSPVVGGQYNPATMAPGVYTYTIVAAAPCVNSSATITVTENAAPNSGTNGTLDVCSNGAASGLFAQFGGTPQAGGAWSGPSAVVGGQYDPATMTPGVYTYTVTGTAPCANATATVTVTENAAANAGTNGTLDVCATGAASSLFAQLGGTPQAGGAWSGPSAVVGGQYDPATMTPGVYTYTVTGTAPCANATATVTVTENTAPNAGTNGTLDACSNGAAVGLFAQLGGTPQGGGAWSGPSAVVGGQYDPATMTPGVYTYTVTGLAPCTNATATVTVTENTAANAGTNGTLDVCATGTATSLFAQLGGAPQVGGAWSGPSAVIGGQYDPATMAPGIYTYTVTGVAPCANATATVTVTENAAPNAGTNGTLGCVFQWSCGRTFRTAWWNATSRRRMERSKRSGRWSVRPGNNDSGCVHVHGHRLSTMHERYSDGHGDGEHCGQRRHEWHLGCVCYWNCHKPFRSTRWCSTSGRRMERSKCCDRRSVRSGDDGAGCLHLHSDRRCTLCERDCYRHGNRERSPERGHERYAGCVFQWSCGRTVRTARWNATSWRRMERSKRSGRWSI